MVFQSSSHFIISSEGYSNPRKWLDKYLIKLNYSCCFKYFHFSPTTADITTLSLSKSMSLLVTMHQLYYYLEKLYCEFLSVPSPLLFTVEALHRSSLFFIPFTHIPILINFPRYLVKLLLSWKLLSTIANYKDQFSLSSHQT